MKKLNIGLSMNLFAGKYWDTEKILETIAKYFRNVEIVFDKPYFWLEDLELARMAEIKNFLKQHNLTVVDVSSCTAGGYERLVSIEDSGIRFNILYLTDYEQMNLSEKARFKKKIKRYPLDLCILGMPIPFPERDKKERPHGQRHMGIENTMSFFKEMQDEDFVRPKARIVLTHISDREKDEEELKEEKEVIRKHWNPKLLWIPKNDGFQITHSHDQLTKKGMTI